MNLLEALIDSIVVETLMEMNAISMGAGLLHDGNITDENFDQVGAQDHPVKEKQREFMWGGDEPNNAPPKIKYVGT